MSTSPIDVAQAAVNLKTVVANTVGKDQAQQIYRAFYQRVPAEKRRSPAHCAQETPRPQAVLRYIPNLDAGVIRESSPP